MTWYWNMEGDSIVIRDDPVEGEYVCEIDIRYLTSADLEKAKKLADRIIEMENNPCVTKNR